MNYSDDRLRQAVHDALMKISKDTGEHPAAVMLEALTTSVMILTVMKPDTGGLDRLVRLAIKAGHELRQELNCQDRADQATMTA